MRTLNSCCVKRLKRADCLIYLIGWENRKDHEIEVSRASVQEKGPTLPVLPLPPTLLIIEYALMSLSSKSLSNSAAIESRATIISVFICEPCLLLIQFLFGSPNQAAFHDNRLFEHLRDLSLVSGVHGRFKVQCDPRFGYSRLPCGASFFKATLAPHPKKSDLPTRDRTDFNAASSFDAVGGLALSWSLTLFTGLWLCEWAAGEVMVLREVFKGGKPPSPGPRSVSMILRFCSL